MAGVNSGDQTAIAEMLIKTPFSQKLSQVLVETWQKLINPSKNFLLKLIKIKALQVKGDWIR